MKQLINKLLAHQPLSLAEASDALHCIGKGEAAAAQMSAFITVYLMRPVTPDELTGFRQAMLQLCLPFNLQGIPAMDMCGTGGDGKSTFNISTTSAFVVAGAGQPVAKHGNYGVSSGCGSSTVMEQLGYRFSNNQNQLLQQLEKAEICFLHAPLFHPVMKNVASVRKELGIKTFFNMLGPLVNPARPDRQLTGVFSLELARLYHYIFQQEQKPSLYSIVHSLDGYDEISLTDSVRVLGPGKEQQLQASDFGSPKLNPNDLAAADSVADSAEILISILSGKGTKAQTEVVLANSAMALQTAQPAISLPDAKLMAQESINSGKALGCLKTLISLS